MDFCANFDQWVTTKSSFVQTVFILFLQVLIFLLFFSFIFTEFQNIWFCSKTFFSKIKMQLIIILLDKLLGKSCTYTDTENKSIIDSEVWQSKCLPNSTGSQDISPSWVCSHHAHPQQIVCFCKGHIGDDLANWHCDCEQTLRCWEE